MVKQSIGEYDWLWKYDRTWLKAHLPPRKARRPTSSRWPRRGKRLKSKEGQRILPHEWERRDQVTSEAIRKRAQELLDAPGAPQKITLVKLRQDIVSSSHWRTNTALLPMTMQALDEVLESTERFAARRVNWVAQQALSERKPLLRWVLVRQAGVDRQYHKPLVQAAIQEAMSILDCLN